MQKRTNRLRILPVITAIALVVLVTGCRSKPIAGKPKLPNGFSEISGHDITFQWKISGETMEGYLSAPTNGWVAIGFNPTKMMKDANFIIGYVREGTAAIRDDFGSWFTSHTSDEKEGGSSDVTLISGEEKEGWTILHFSFPLDSGDAFDRIIVPGAKTIVLFAFGASDDFAGMHRQKAKQEVVF